MPDPAASYLAATETARLRADLAAADRIEPADALPLILARARAVVPSGCAHCGLDRRAHVCRWIAPVGWHTYAPPSQAQILVRMLARRAARTPDSTTAPDGPHPAGADTTTPEGTST